MSDHIRVYTEKHQLQFILGGDKCLLAIQINCIDKLYKAFLMNNSSQTVND